MIDVIAVLPTDIVELGKEIGSVWPLWLAILGILAGARKLYIRETQKVETEVLSKIQTELAPVIETLTTHNGGSTLKDIVGNINVEQKTQRFLLNEVVKDGAYAKARLRAVISSDNEAHYECDADAKVVYVNKAYLELTGLNRREALNGDIEHLIDPTDLHTVLTTAEFGRENQSEWSTEFWMERKTDGKRMHIQVKTYPIYSDGFYYGYVGSLTPIPG